MGMDKRPAYYCQVDARWKKMRYAIGKGTGTIGSAGCGPTTAAMIVATWCDPKITPVEMCAWAVANGYRTENNGTYRSLFYGVGKKWGLRYQEVYNQTAAKACLDAGGLVACHVGPGRWTSGGHYILWWKYSGNTVHINDPSGDTAKRNTGTLAELSACAKAYVCFWPKEAQEPEKPKEEENDMTKEQFMEWHEEAEKKRKEAEIFVTLEDVPEWARPTVERLMDKKFLSGTGNGELNLTMDLIRLMVINERAGLYG